MSQALENLRQIIIGANVSEEDKNDLLVFLPIFPNETIESLTKHFQKNSKAIKEFNLNFRNRLKVLVGIKDDELDEKMKKENVGEFLDNEEEEFLDDNEDIY
ncbi:MAG: hypothetical protein AAB526_02710 [Patescibacteria group bacterium]